MIAACTLDPGVYLSMNVKGAPAETVAKITALGFPVTVEQMDQVAQTAGEKTLFGRTGGATTLAVGMAHIFSKVIGGRGLDLWYHFAIMFEALFILTTIDAGTRVGRYLLHDFLGHLWKPLGDTRKLGANLFASLLLVGAWGLFLIQGVRDPLGGINSLWPLFGIANQLLAAIALCLATTVILKMQLQKSAKNGNPALALITLVPLLWLLAVTMTAGLEKIFHSDPRIGFLARANALDAALPSLGDKVTVSVTPAALDAARKAHHANRVECFNQRLDAVVCAVFLALVAVILVISLREWTLLLARKRFATLRETDSIWLPAEGSPVVPSAGWLGIFVLLFALTRELSGEAAIERERSELCQCGQQPDQAYVAFTTRRFDSKSINRCC